MAVLPKESRDLLEAARHIKTQIKQVKENKQFSDSYKLEFEKKQLSYFEEAIDNARRKAGARAALMRDRAKQAFLEDEARPTKALEMSIFRDQIAGASKDDLIKLSLSPADLSPTKVLALGAELRRRDMDIYADELAKKCPADAEPWRLSEDWKAAEALLEQFEGLKVAETLSAQMGADRGPLILTEDGPTPAAVFFAEK
jgi:hypothetical protein